MLKHFEFWQDIVKLYFDNFEILYMSADDFIFNFDNIFDFSYEEMLSFGIAEKLYV